MALRNGSSRLIKQYAILVVFASFTVGFAIGEALIIRAIARGGPLWLLALIFTLTVPIGILQCIVWIVLVLAKHFREQVIAAVLSRCWYLPQRKIRQLEFRFRYGAREGVIYHPLNHTKRQIRLLNIRPGRPHEEISCYLLPVELGQNTPTYQALSYTWGRDQTPHHILLNDCHFIVTSHLYGALNFLRDTDIERFVWVDALCINQSSLPERGQQVSLMRLIYSQAAETIIWLGDETATSNVAMEYLRAASVNPDLERWFITRLQDDFESLIPVWEGITQLFQRNYWSRVWIIQETAVSANLQVSCGRYSVPWDVAVAAQNAWVKFRGSTLPHSIQSTIESIEGVTAAEGVPLMAIQRVVRNGGPIPLTINRRRIAGSESSTLINLLSDNWLALATDPRDKIYALLGLATDCQDPMLRADYSLSKFDTYLKMLKYLLQVHGSLDLIAYSGIHIMTNITSHFYRVPSWIPAFYWTFEARTTGVASQYIYSTPFKASGTLRAVASFRACFRRFDHLLGIQRVHLHAQACHIDTIAQVLFNPSKIFSIHAEVDKLRKKFKIATTWHPTTFMPSLLNADRNRIDEIRALYHFFVLNGEPETAFESEEVNQVRALKTDILWRTLVLNRTLDGNPAPDTWSEDFYVLINGPAILRSLPAVPNADTSSEYKEAVAAAIRQIQPLLQTIQKLSQCQRFMFLTQNGRIGIANNSAKVGDQICVILGCSMPMVARIKSNKTSEHSEEGGTKATLCGAAYVHEYMYGLAIDEIESGQRELEWFEFS